MNSMFLRWFSPNKEPPSLVFVPLCPLIESLSLSRLGVKKQRVDLQQVGSFTLESHHGIPKKIQEWLGLTKNKDSVPAYLTTMLEHRGAEVGIHQRLEKKLGDLIGTDKVSLNKPIPDALKNQPDLILRALEETYEEAGLSHFWEVCEEWINQ